MKFESTTYELQFMIEDTRKVHYYDDQQSLFNAFVEWQSKGAFDIECFEITKKDLTQDIEELANNDRR